MFRDEILDILREFTEDRGPCGAHVLHITSDLDKIADYIAYLHEGKMQFIKTCDEIRNDYGIITCGQELFDTLSRETSAAYKKEPYSYRVLVKNRAKLRQGIPGYSDGKRICRRYHAILRKREKVK